MREMIARAADLLRRIVGEQCIVCGLTAHADGFCLHCADDLPRLQPPLCTVCAEPVNATLCGRCLKHRPLYDNVIAAREYTYPLNAMLRQLKYQGNLVVARGAGALLREAVRYSLMPDLIVPMPLSKSRQRERGFNQSIEIAKALPIDIRGRRIAHVLTRVNDTIAQTQLTTDARAKNLRNAFRAKARLDGARVALVDDVMTTGATLNEAARALKAAGASHVSGWVVARTVSRNRK